MVSVKNLKKTYCNKYIKYEALRGVSLDIKKGEFIMLMGPSGCGKTTLLNILGCMDTFTCGSYSFNGSDVHNMNARELAKFRSNNIRFIFQSFNLVNELNCIDNIEITMGYAGVKKSERRKRSCDLIRRIGLEDKKNNFPTQLSGGQQQRVAIARAISNNPKLLLADEPTGNLDQETSTVIMNMLSELNREGVTILMATHNPDLIKIASRVIEMKDGVIVNE